MVRSVAFASGNDEPVVLSVCDLIGLTRVPGPKGRRVVACTHTHHGPDGRLAAHEGRLPADADSIIVWCLEQAAVAA